MLYSEILCVLSATQFCRAHRLPLFILTLAEIPMAIVFPLHNCSYTKVNQFSIFLVSALFPMAFVFVCDFLIRLLH